ncbi:unnamed protein product [Rotaria sordida]|uniref:Uncharacterized protein n=1 Tax=Rotaria sordida TaxID=392033 RepID=A0A819LFL9_9BILA|nr:unnamed protein product [Rotaria sordida]
MICVYDETFFDKPIPSHIRLPNIESLHIKLPINDQFWSIVPNLDLLKSFTVLSHANTFQSQFQTVLDRARHLDTLAISQDALLPLQISLFTYRSTSIHRLDLRNCNYYFNEDECITLSRSPLCASCEVLCIQVKTRESIIILVKNVINLRALNVVCKDDPYYDNLPIIENNDGLDEKKIPDENELLSWLKSRLPSYFIVRHPNIIDKILIWI